MKNVKRLFKDNGMELLELRWMSHWWKGAEVFKEGDGYTDGMATTAGWKVWNYDGGKVQRCLRKATGTRPEWQ